MTNTPAIPSEMTAAQLAHILQVAMSATKENAETSPWNYGHGACGFAWTRIKMRKNARLHKVLKEFGFHWNGYYKVWEFAAVNHVKLLTRDCWQSMDYRASVEGVFVFHLNGYGIRANVSTHID